jgi:5-methyltetrahydrofolate corrinoid/iron sulfur protein methyltransferase
MIIIGELINASRKAIKAAIEAQDAESIQKVAKEQADAGADYIDVNAGIFVGKEPEYLKWLVETVQQATDKPCAIDSPDPAAIEMALSMHQGTPMINSISLEKERYEKLMPIVANTDMKVNLHLASGYHRLTLGKVPRTSTLLPKEVGHETFQSSQNLDRLPQDPF